MADLADSPVPPNKATAEAQQYDISEGGSEESGALSLSASAASSASSTSTESSLLTQIYKLKAEQADIESF